MVTVPGIGGYEAFFREGPNWIRATQNSLWVMAFSTTTAVILGFVYAYAMVYSRMPWKPFFRLHRDPAAALAAVRGRGQLHPAVRARAA